MPSRPPISVTLIAQDEAEEIARAIRSVSWAEEILVVDSGSRDRTREIARGLGARVIENPWPGFGAQKNFAQSQASHDWVLNIDADEEVPPELARKIQEEVASPGRAVGYSFPRKTFYLGRWIRHGGWYPNRLTRLADRRHARWTEPEVHESLEVKGEIRELAEPLHHYTFRNIEDQILANLRYSRAGSKDLTSRGQRASLVKLLAKPVGKFAETYFVKRGFLDGLPGLIISINASHSMFLKYAYLYEKELE